jgi:hypothetical protein
VEIRSNTVYSTLGDGIDGRGQAVVVVSNIVHDVGKDGVHVEDASAAQVQHNVIYDTGERGIYARCDACTIVNNTVYDTGSDGIRTHKSSTDVGIYHNTVYSTGTDGIDARGAAVTVVGNRVTGCADNGIEAEDVGSWVHIEANWGLNNTVGIAVQSAPVFTLTNNVVGDNVISSVELTGTAIGFVYHNTLVGSGTGVQGTALAVLSPLTLTLANNIIVSHTVGITVTAGATLSASHTLLWGNSSDPISGTGVITGAPLFVRPASQNYHLLPDSPAVDAGIDVGVLTDVDGDPRLSAPDIGADEIVQKVYLPLVMRVY